MSNTTNANCDKRQSEVEMILEASDQLTDITNKIDKLVLNLQGSFSPTDIPKRFEDILIAYEQARQNAVQYSEFPTIERKLRDLAQKWYHLEMSTQAYRG